MPEAAPLTLKIGIDMGTTLASRLVHTGTATTPAWAYPSKTRQILRSVAATR